MLKLYSYRHSVLLYIDIKSRITGFYVVYYCGIIIVLALIGSIDSNWILIITTKQGI